MPQSPRVCQLKIILLGSTPPIWRRLLVPADIRLDRLHLTIQVAMGWEDSHLHQFIIRGAHYQIPYPDGDDFGLKSEDERKVRLSDVAIAPKTRFRYEYDFGDGWEHDIVIEKIEKPEKGIRYPLCIAGGRACPPEDVGGIGGYEEFLAVMASPKNREHKDMREWIGGDFDPETFDIDAVNDGLRRIR